MPTLISYLIYLATYVLYSLGLYIIANRRGIRNAWLAWLPVGNIWILGAIADDYRARHTGRKHNMRSWLVISYVVMSVLLVAVLVFAVMTMSNILTVNELTDLYLSTAGLEDDLYAVSQEEMIQELSLKIEERMTDEVAAKLAKDTLVLLAVSLLLLVVAIAASVLELICLYRLFASCDPQNALLYFLLGMLLGVMAVFVFLCRNKDLGLVPPAPPTPPVTGYMPPAQVPREQN